MLDEIKAIFNNLYFLHFFNFLLAIKITFILQKTQACLYFGRAISSEDYLIINKNGFQDALTNPSDTKLSIIIFVGVLVFWFCAFLTNNFYTLIGLFFANIFIVSVTSQFLPKIESRYYLIKIYNSLSNRYADYVKNNDSVRAESCGHLISLIEEKFNTNAVKQ